MSFTRQYTFYDIVYSVCGAAVSKDIYDILKSVDYSILAESEKQALDYMLEAYEKDGAFPTYSYMKQTFQYDSVMACYNVADFKRGFSDFIEQRKAHLLRTELAAAITDEVKAQELKDRIENIFEQSKTDDSVLSIKKYEGLKEHYEQLVSSSSGGFVIGVEPVDNLTGGFQPALTAVVAAYVSHGKSMTSYNGAYLQALRKEYTLIVSLEIDATYVYYILLSRYSYDTDRPIKYEALMQGILTDEEKEYVFGELEPKFKEEIAPYIMVVNGDVVPAYTRKGILSLYTAASEIMGGLGAVVWDHANLFLYVEKERDITGNHIIKTIADCGKEFYDKRGKRIASVVLAQVNREGYKKAKRTEGNSYDMTALSDFNELERSGTYVVFAFAEREMLDAGQMSYELVKNRIGRKMLAPEIVEAAPAYAKIGGSYKEAVDNIQVDLYAQAGDSWLGNNLGDGLPLANSPKPKSMEQVKEQKPDKPIHGASKRNGESGTFDPSKDA